jgi:beta-lactamase class D
LAPSYICEIFDDTYLAMTGKKIIGLSALLMLVAVVAFKQRPKKEIRDDFKKYYDEFHVTGSFVLYDENKDHWILCNASQLNEQFIPASTFKICNSLIGLETGVIPDEHFVLHWDGIVRQNPKWNTDHDLKSAYKNFVVWYYQELARRVGKERMNYWLTKAQYGNMDMSGRIDSFWLTGGLRVTPEQQIDFLRRLKHNKVPFSQRSIDIVKRIMVVKDTLNYVVRAKTGWGDEPKKMVGWYVGYVERNNNVYYFANCIQSTNPEMHDFGGARLIIACKILDELRVTRE